MSTVETDSSLNLPTSDLSAVVVNLMKGVIYSESHPSLWSALFKMQSKVRDFVNVIGLELIIDEAEGYAFLRSRVYEDDDDNATPRLVARRQLSFQTSLLLALLRKKLLELDTKGGGTRLILSVEEMTEMVRVFLPDGTNEAKIIDQVESNIGKVENLGFLRALKNQSGQSAKLFEVRRILKAFVDAQWLSEFDAKLAEYAERLKTESS